MALCSGTMETFYTSVAIIAHILFAASSFPVRVCTGVSLPFLIFCKTSSCFVCVQAVFSGAFFSVLDLFSVFCCLRGAIFLLFSVFSFLFSARRPLCALVCFLALEASGL